MPFIEPRINSLEITGLRFVALALLAGVLRAERDRAAQFWFVVVAGGQLYHCYRCLASAHACCLQHTGAAFGTDEASGASSTVIRSITCHCKNVSTVI